MSDIDDFTTASNRASFQSYPPIMALWQYMFQKISLWSGRRFSEWRVFFAYQLFALSILFPFLKNMKKDILNMAAGFVLIFFVPAIVYPALYWSVDIDVFVGMFAGAGFLMVLMRSEFEKTYSLIYLSMLCFCLVLAKDVGLYFAILILIAFYIELFFEWRQTGYLNKGGGSKRKYGLLLYAVPLGTVVVSRASWRLKLMANNMI